MVIKNNKSTEDYIECILLLSRESEFVHRVDVARKMNVTPPAVQKAVKILQTEGFIECDGLHIHLTPSGNEYAKQVYDRHCTLKKYLLSIGVSRETAETDACEIEHVISEETFNAIKKSIR